MADQTELLDRLNKFIDDYGSTQSFICSKTRIVRSELCRFRQKTVVLAPLQVKRLDEFLKSRGY